MPMSQATRLFLRDLLLLLGLPLLLVFGILGWWQPWRGPEPWAAPADTDVFAVVTGKWDLADAEGMCEANPHIISFSSDRSVMFYETREPWTDIAGIQHNRAEYDVLEHAPNRIRGRMRGEKRLTFDGEPVVWDLLLTDPDTYRWHRIDLPIGGYFGRVVRCEGNKAAALMTEGNAASPEVAAEFVCPSPHLLAQRLNPGSPPALIGSDTLYPPEMVESPPRMQGTVTVESGRVASAEDTGAVVVRYAVSPAGRVPSCYVQILESPTEGLSEDVHWMLTHSRFWPARRAGRNLWMRAQDTVRFVGVPAILPM